MLSPRALLVQELHEAASAGNLQKLQALLHGLGVEQGAWLRGAVIRAVYADEAVAARVLLEAGAPVDAVDDLGQTPLHWAARRGLESLAQHLVEHGASVDCKSQDGSTPLHLSVERDCGPIVKMLVANRADPAGMTHDKRSALHLAAECNSAVATAVLLADRIQEESTPCSSRPKSPGNDGEAVPLQLTPDPLLELENGRGETALMRASARGSAVIAQLLLRAGADPEHRNLWGQGALQLAALQNQVTCAAVLLDGSADVNSTARDGATPLHAAVDRGHGQVVELFLARGANLLSRAARGRTALHVAAERGCLAAIEALVANGAQIDARSDDLATPLLCAASRGHAEVAVQLMDAGADPQAVDSLRQMPLHAAAAAGRTKVAELLIRRRVHLEQQDAAGRTPMLLALSSKQESTVRLLLKNGAILPEDVANAPDMQPLMREVEHDMLEEQMRETEEGQPEKRLKNAEKHFESARLELLQTTASTAEMMTAPVVKHAENELATARELVRVRRIAERGLIEQVKGTSRAASDTAAEAEDKRQSLSKLRRSVEELKVSNASKQEELKQLPPKIAEELRQYELHVQTEAQLANAASEYRTKTEERSAELTSTVEDCERLEAQLVEVREQLAKWNAEKLEAVQLHAQAQALLNRA